MWELNICLLTHSSVYQKRSKTLLDSLLRVLRGQSHMVPCRVGFWLRALEKALCPSPFPWWRTRPLAVVACRFLLYYWTLGSGHILFPDTSHLSLHVALCLPSQQQYIASFLCLEYLWLPFLRTAREKALLVKDLGDRIRPTKRPTKRRGFYFIY